MGQCDWQKDLLHDGVFFLAGTVVASLLPLPSAKTLGIGSAEADTSESESCSGSSADTHAVQDQKDAAVAARYVLYDLDATQHLYLYKPAC